MESARPPRCLPHTPERECNPLSSAAGTHGATRPVLRKLRGAGPCCALPGAPQLGDGGVGVEGEWGAGGGAEQQAGRPGERKSQSRPFLPAPTEGRVQGEAGGTASVAVRRSHVAGEAWAAAGEGGSSLRRTGSASGASVWPWGPVSARFPPPAPAPAPGGVSRGRGILRGAAPPRDGTSLSPPRVRVSVCTRTPNTRLSAPGPPPRTTSLSSLSR